MTEESYIIVYTILLSQNLTQKIRKMSQKMTEESYIIVYTILLSQNMTQKIRKMSEKND